MTISEIQIPLSSTIVDPPDGVVWLPPVPFDGEIRFGFGCQRLRIIGGNENWRNLNQTFKTIRYHHFTIKLSPSLILIPRQQFDEKENREVISESFM
jgi:hypothetical protein